MEFIRGSPGQYGLAQHLTVAQTTDKFLSFFPPCLPCPAFGPHRDQRWEGPRQWPAHPNNSSPKLQRNYSVKSQTWLHKADCFLSMTWRQSLILWLTPGRTTCHQLSDTDFGGTSRGSISKNIPAWPLVLGVRAETLRQNRGQHWNAGEKHTVVFAIVKCCWKPPCPRPPPDKLCPGSWLS